MNAPDVRPASPAPASGIIVRKTYSPSFARLPPASPTSAQSSVPPGSVASAVSTPPFIYFFANKEFFVNI